VIRVGTSASRVPPPKPPFEEEEQMILRVPTHMAQELRKMIREANGRQFDKRVAFCLECTLNFEINLDLRQLLKKSYYPELVLVLCDFSNDRQRCLLLTLTYSL
jgi:hypothetical protein